MPAIGQPAPDFELQNQNGKTVRLSDYRGKKVIIFAFPKANTSGCNRQACAFRDSWHRIEAEDAVLLGVSTDSPAALADWKAAKNLRGDLLSDPDRRMLSDWGAWGIDLKIFKLGIAATRSFWVIDEQGILVAQQIGVHPLESVDKALKAIAALD